MTKNRRRTMVILCMAVSQFIFIQLPVFAQDAATPKGGITISPAFQELILPQDQPLLKGLFSIANNTDSPQTYRLDAIDMGSLDDTGGVLLSGLPQDYRDKYGLAAWLSLAEQTTTVPPHKTVNVNFTVENKETLTPGGHYGAIVVTPTAAAGGSGKELALSPQTASLLFLRKVGGEKYGINVTSMSDDHSTWHMPTKVDLRFKNEGNVHAVPRGIVRVKDGFGKEVARGIINQESALILPERTRTLHVPLQMGEPTIWPGRYTIEVAYRYDGEEQLKYVTKTFYTANLRILLIATASIAAVGFGLYKGRRRIVGLLRRIKHFYRDRRR